MTLWHAYLLLLHRLGLGPKPDLPHSGQWSVGSRQRLATSGQPLSTTHYSLLELAAGLAFALAGQWSLANFRDTPIQGAALLAVGVGLWAAALWPRVAESASPGVDSPQPIALPGFEPRPHTGIRWRAVSVALVFTTLTLLTTGGNNFSVLGRISWVACMGAWLAAFWDGPLPPRRDWRGAVERWWQSGFTVRLSRTLGLLALVLAASAVFRFARLNQVPIEMTSDHVEKLLDVNDILNNGRRPVFEPNNGGREVMAFYLDAIAARFAGTGLTHLTLKLVTATAGFLTLPFIFLLARELTSDDLIALLATLAAGIGWWPNVISRNGLRFPLAPLFGAAALWLIVRAIRRESRNDALLAGLVLGVGLYGYTPIRAVPPAAALALVLYALHRRGRSLTLKLGGWLVMLTIVMLAGAVPLMRYAIDDPENFWQRTFTRITGDPESQAPPSTQVFLQNEWNSLRMFSWTADSAWLVSPANQPALDWVMGALFALGVATLFVRFARRRDWRDAFLLLSIPVLLLPSTLALAFPIENPSLHRSGAAIPIVFIIVAIPLSRLVEHWRALRPGRAGSAAGVAAAALLIVVSAQANWKIVFVDYATQYHNSAQNASELGRIVRAWADSVGDWDTVTIRAYPNWVDTRAVGIYAGKFGWNNVILSPDQFDDLVNDPRPKLYIVNRHDPDMIPTLRVMYPQGKLTFHPSQFLDKDFYTFFVPGTVDFDEKTLAP